MPVTVLEMLAEPAGSHPLPSPEHAEVNLRRLLARLESTLAQAAAATNDPDTRVDRPVHVKYHSNVVHLRRLLASVETARRRDDSALCEYRRRVEQLEAALDATRLLSSVGRTVSSLRALAALPPEDSDARLAAADGVLRMQRKAEDQMREMLLDNALPRQELVFTPDWAPSVPEPAATSEKPYDGSFAAGARGTTKQALLDGSSSPSPLRLSTPARLSTTQTPSRPSTTTQTVDHAAVLERDRKLQEQMTEEMIMKAAQLKKSAMAMGDQLKKDALIVDDATDHLSSNLTHLNSARTRLLQLNKTARTTTWMIWGSVFFVCIAFVFTFMVMRLFKPTAVVPAAPRPQLQHHSEETGDAMAVHAEGWWPWISRILLVD
ncbi:hypothetical protein HDU87_005037 [Geranomyces variabilis]|uniref:Uncharacterized protein n=1 Tax=Geranomyces variabilis TaxID=109894 RepID=A0AAD5XTD0_9FUNG|nr:hypothetical protein HDU87_005037 [Geranomyces variabilis]